MLSTLAVVRKLGRVLENSRDVAHNDWFLLSCVVLPWAVEQYDAALAPVG